MPTTCVHISSESQQNAFPETVYAESLQFGEEFIYCR